MTNVSTMTKKNVHTCTKKDFIKIMARHCDMSYADTDKALTSFFNSIKEVVSQGDKVNFMGFGSFSLLSRPARDGRNPSTGEKMKIPASNTIKFRMGKFLKDSVN